MEQRRNCIENGLVLRAQENNNWLMFKIETIFTLKLNDFYLKKKYAKYHFPIDPTYEILVRFKFLEQF